jgi:chromosome segregation ATPase
MSQWIIVALTAMTALSATGFVVIAVLWLRRLRETVSTALTEAANQQVRTSQRLGDAIAQLQKQQQHYEHQLQTLAQAGLRLRQELVNMSTRLEHSQSDIARGDHTLH